MAELIQGVRVMLLTVLVTVVLGLSGCGTEEQIGAPGVGAVTPNAAECVPVKVALLQDQTGSTSWTRTPQFAREDLNPVLDLLRKCGGEIGFGLIRDESNRPLIRVSIQRAPERPVEPSESNPFRAAKLKNDPRHQQELAKYKEDGEKWRKSAEGAISDFISGIGSVLHPKLAKSTDIWGAVQRAEVFLSEDDAVWKTETHRWAIFLTDGLHNTRTREAALSEKTRVVVVNASNEVGVFVRFNPRRFESSKAAFEYVVAEEMRGK